MTVWTINDLRVLGMTPADVRRRVTAGELVRVARGYYTDAADARPEDLHLARARAMALPDGACFTHYTAALLHGLPLVQVPQDPWVAEGRSRHSARRRDRRTCDLARVGGDVTTVQGLRCTGLARTVVDLACVTRFDAGVVAADAALHLARLAGREDALRAELATTLELHRRRRGVPRARSVAEFADGRAESAGESLSRIAFTTVGLPKPTLQFIVRDAAGRFLGRCDFGWEDRRVLGEYDGEAKYGDLGNATPREALLSEKRREQRLQSAGWLIVRWGKSELREPWRLEHLVRAAFANAHRLALAEAC